MTCLRQAAILVLVFVAAARAEEPPRPPASKPDTAPPRSVSLAADAVRAAAVAAARGEKASDLSKMDQAERESYEQWLGRNRESVEGVRPAPLADLPWGVSTFRPATGGESARLYLHVFEWHASGKLVAYGLVGGAKKAYLLGDASHAPLEIEQRERSAVISVPKQPPDGADTVVVVECDAEPRVASLALRPSEDGKLVLHARDAVVHGRTLRYEPEPHKNTLGYWSDPADRATWQFEIVRPGEYAVHILQGCGKGSGGSTVEFRAAGRVLPVVVEDTGGFQNFVSRDIGRITFPDPGVYTLEVRPLKKPGVAVMDLRQVTIAPVAAP